MISTGGGGRFGRGILYPLSSWVIAFISECLTGARGTWKFELVLFGGRKEAELAVAVGPLASVLALEYRSWPGEYEWVELMTELVLS